MGMLKKIGQSLLGTALWITTPLHPLFIFAAAPVMIMIDEMKKSKINLEKKCGRQR